jgi:hypothetical protein
VSVLRCGGVLWVLSVVFRLFRCGGCGSGIVRSCMSVGAVRGGRDQRWGIRFGWLQGRRRGQRRLGSGFGCVGWWLRGCLGLLCRAGRQRRGRSWFGWLRSCGRGSRCGWRAGAGRPGGHAMRSSCGRQCCSWLLGGRRSGSSAGGRARSFRSSSRRCSVSASASGAFVCVSSVRALSLGPRVRGRRVAWRRSSARCSFLRVCLRPRWVWRPGGCLAAFWWVGPGWRF